jgi:hypothetical protein
LNRRHPTVRAIHIVPVDVNADHMKSPTGIAPRDYGAEFAYAEDRESADG